MSVKSIASAGLGIVVVAVAVIVLAAGGSSAHNKSSVAAGSAVGVRSTSLGPTLVDANGRTLYLFAGDKPDVSRVSAAGLAVWPPFRPNGTVKATNGANAASLGTITSSGGRQVTYNGHPLYYYVGDSSAGSTHGQRLNQFGALWYVLGPGGNAVTRASTAQAAPMPSAGYGY